MRLESVSIANFRCYQQEVTVWFNDLTTFIGKNDIGKSSVLEALEIFFNNEGIYHLRVFRIAAPLDPRRGCSNGASC